MSMTRLITAIVLLPILILYVMKLSAGYFTILLTAASVLALIEFYMMYRVKRIDMVLGAVLGGLIIVCRYYGHFEHAVFGSVLLVSAYRLFIRPEPSGALSDIAPLIFGLLYIPGLMSFQLGLRGFSPALVLFLYLTVWLSDAAAYYIGTNFGRHKLYKSMSPNKTWEGAAGSVAGGLAGAMLVKYLFKMKYLSVELTLVLGLAIGVIAICGDLVESMLKRDAGVKDSGSLIPGHGGFLDKIDGSVYAGPVMFWILQYSGVFKNPIRFFM